MTHPDDAQPDANPVGPGFLTPALDERTAADASDLGSRYRALIDHLPAVLYIDGVAAGTAVLDVSPRIHDLLGIEPAGTNVSTPTTESASSPHAIVRSRPASPSGSSTADSTGAARSCGSATRRS